MAYPHTQVVRLKRGVLDTLPSLPLDILCEIFCFLLPPDLLVLARTSKAFRSFLLKRSAAFIWRSARRNVDGLPEPLSDMNEVQLASLVFGLACYYKGCDKKARDTVWHLRIRSCAGCRPKHQSVNVNENQDSLAVCAMLKCDPNALEQYIPCGPFLNSKGKSIKGIQENHIKTFKDGLSTLAPKELEAYLDHCKHSTELITRFARTGIAWQLNDRSTRITEMNIKRMARAEIIRKSLITAGFGEEIDYFGWDRVRKHPLISSTRALTDRAHSSVLGQLREYMVGWRELRMEEKIYVIRRKVFVDTWFRFTTTAFRDSASCSAYFPLPPSSTIGFSEGIDSIIRQSGPISPESLLDQFYAAFFQIDEYILGWHKTIRRKLASLLPDYRPDVDDDAIHAQLKLASSVFHCNGGPGCRREGRPLVYPEILFHPCFTLVKQATGPSSRDPRVIAHQKACLTMGGGSWNCSGLVQLHPSRYMVKKVLSCCGKDPRSTTASEMDNQDPRLACAECCTLHRVVVLMTWRQAVLHSIVLHPGSTLDHPWIMACRAVTIRTNALETQLSRPFSSALGGTLCDYSVCLHCPPRILSWNTRVGLGDLMGHFKNRHGISSPALGKDYVFDQNITAVSLNPIITRRKVLM